MHLHRRFALGALALTLAIPFTGTALAQAVPDDETPTIDTLADGEGDRANGGAVQDKPTVRLMWQRKAWGTVTPAFRATATSEGRSHGDKKNITGPRWVSIGPTTAAYQQNGSFTGHVQDSGRARVILPHPTHPETVYMLTSGGGLWRTDNWSKKSPDWTVLTDNLPITGGGSVAFGRNPNTLYLGLGDPIDLIQVGGAVVKSNSGGVEWSAPIDLGDAVSVRDIKVDTSTNRDIVLVATDSGLYRSADEGASFQAVAGFAGQSVWSLVQTSGGWLASAQPCPVGAGGLICGQATKLYLSTDRGLTWNAVASPVLTNMGRTSLAVAVPGDAVVYAYASDTPDAQMRDVFRSGDGGLTWSANGVNATKIPTNPVAGSMPNMNICHGQCWYNQMVMVDPRDPSRNTVWIGGDLATARSTDGGATWTIKTWWLYSQVPGLPYAHADHHFGVVKMTGTPSIILGEDGGLRVSEDDGATFSSDKNAGLVSLLYYTIAGNPKFPQLVIGGTQDNGTRLRAASGTTHNQVIGGDGMGAATSQQNTNTVMGSSQSSGIRTSLSNNAPIVFQNWVARGALADAAGAGFFTAVVPAPGALDPTGRVFFHFTASRVWRTNDGGLNWIRLGSATAPVSPGLPATRRFRSSPYNLGVSPQDLNRIAVGAGGGFIDITTDGGATWTDVNLVALAPGYQGFVTNVTWADNRTIWVTSVAQASGAVRVVKGTIAAAGDSWSTATWTARQNGLPDLPVTRVAVDPRDASGNTLLAATHVGVYRTVDGGLNWTSFSAGLPNVRVNDIYMPPDGGFVRIATYGRGVWELPQLELVATKLDDNGDKCDRDGVLDNNEAGDLSITLRNYGPNNVSRITVTVTSSNPHVTFPDGNTINFSSLNKDGVDTRPIRVALSGAAIAEAVTFNIAVDAPELGLPSPLRVEATHLVNYDDVASASTKDTVLSGKTTWSVSGGAQNLPNILNWQRRSISPTQWVWWGPDNNGQADDTRGDLPDEQILTSPVLKVGTAPVTLSFRHRFAFENGGWDGGVIEGSTDGGATWASLPGVPYNGALNTVTASPIGAGRPAFVNRPATWPSFVPVSVNLGTAFANKDLRIRFRVGADESTGAPGWEVGDIEMTGIANNPFSALVANTTSCSPKK